MPICFHKSLAHCSPLTQVTQRFYYQKDRHTQFLHSSQVFNHKFKIQLVETKQEAYFKIKISVKLSF